MQIKLPLFSVLLIAAIAPSTSFAQYVWLDERGVKQFTDAPPPPATPRSRIIKAPSGSQSPSNKSPAENNAASAAISGEKLQKPVTTASQNEDFNKRKSERAEKESKAAAEAQAVKDKAKFCEKNQAYQRSLESGVRIATTDKNGERVFLDDAQRAQELAESKRGSAVCK